jgi:lipopolysaccharide export LptBFGC system permease protein LptF
VILCDLTACYSNEGACCQRLKPNYDEPASKFGFKFNLRRYTLPPVALAVAVKGFPFPAYSTNLGSTYAAVFFGLIFVFTFVITVVVIVKAGGVQAE